MQNKRWKRAAKKLIGRCMATSNCSKCGCEKECDRLFDEYDGEVDIKINSGYKSNVKANIKVDIRKAYNAMKVFNGPDYLINRVFKGDEINECR